MKNTSIPYYLLFILFFVASCSPGKDQSKEQKNQVNILNSIFYSSVSIFFTNESFSEQAVINAISAGLPDFRISSEVPDSVTFDGYKISFVGAGDKNFIIPDTSIIYVKKYLTKQELIDFHQSKHAMIITFFGTAKDVANKQLSISKIISSITDGRKVTISDLNTYQFYSRPEWLKNRIANFQDSVKDFTNQITIHFYREEDQLCRAVTMGLDKFCLPELSLKGFPCSEQNSINSLINVTIQTLGENPNINNDLTLNIDLEKIKNAPLRKSFLEDVLEDSKKQTTVKFSPVEPEEGDNYSPQFIFVFDDSNYSSAFEEQTTAIRNLFGSKDDIKNTDHNEELLAASTEAKQHIPELKKMFNAGLMTGSSLMIKLPFRVDDDSGNEWMWVEVTSWSNGKNQGILQNEPFHIKRLKSGAMVDFNEQDIFDYMLYKPDGTFEGNKTGAIIEKQGN